MTACPLDITPKKCLYTTVLLSTETDEKHKLKAKLYLQSHHVTSLENALDKIKEPYSTQTSGTQTDNNEIATINTMLQHDLRLKDEHIETLSNEVEELANKNHTICIISSKLIFARICVFCLYLFISYPE